jgi:DDB1- and CUL4-associated factor 5
MANNNPIVNSLLKRQSGIIPSSSFQSKLFKDRLSIAKNLFKRDLVSHYGCVNAIEFSQEGNWLTSGS